MRYLILIIFMALLVAGSMHVDVQKITPWLLGINFTIAIFSINFTFFGYQLSKYKAIYTNITNRQWFNIVTLLSLPFLPLICYLIIPEYFGSIALWILPLLVFSSIDNAFLTTNYLSPKKFIDDSICDKAISQYLEVLAKMMKEEVEGHQVYLGNREKYQIPTHAYDFEPSTLGLEPNDIWDSIAVITKLSIENNDYPVFRQSLSAILNLVLKFYSFKCKGEDAYKIDGGIKSIARYRSRSIIANIIEHDKSGIFLQSLSSELCDFLMKGEVLDNPCSDMTRSIASDSVWVGKKMIESHSVIEPIKILNTIHRVIEISIYKMENGKSDEGFDSLDKYNISAYAYDIKALGVSALNHENSHFAYRCMETLSYLGCNAAKLKSTQTVVAVFESIVILGRLARNLKIGCFWSRCLIPAESHAEEFMGHILTWLVHDIDSDGNFYMKGYAEQAYSRLRGVKCAIKPKPNSNPSFWIEELEKDGEKIPHIEYESGMYGYGGESDYSDFSNLKEYVLYGIGSESSTRIFRSTPIPMDLEVEEDGNTNNT
ncbi:hypothetical protein [Shewanella algae]|uniref:hypothetical protein n=1 Tax=Shewanella algae TaxID=38313 RepID=UPI00313B3B77